ncbi:MAG: molybdopterin-synthase adenylyltransferase MoeB [Spirochaetota bacterium]
MTFTEDQIVRYSRHIILPDVGGKGQAKLLESKVLVIGAGGLGSPISLYLAAAGVGTLGIVDGDVVDLSNLQRQILHFTSDINNPKVESAREKLEQLNPDVAIKIYNERVTAENIINLIKDYDFIVEGTDNFPSKFLINDACVFLNKPFSQAGILRFDGQTMTHVPGSACYRCVFEAPPPRGVVPSCSEAGVLGVVAGLVGTIQAAETLKYLLGIGQLLVNRILYVNALNMEYTSINLTRNPACPVCGEKPAITELKGYEQPACDLQVKTG